MQVQAARFKRPALKPLNETSAVMEAAVAITCGLENIDTFYDEKTLNLAASKYSHGLGIKEILETAAASKMNTFDRGDVAGLLNAAYGDSQVSPFLTAAASSTINVSGILSNVANKYLLEGFNSVESSWKDVAEVVPVANFKQATFYALGGDATYSKVGSAGEIKHGTLGETSYTNQAETYAKMLSISRRDIINDDLSVLATVPRKLGRGAALALNSVFWNVFLAGTGTHWTAGRANLITGGGSALSATSLQTATTAFRAQTDPDANPLGIEPSILLVPGALEYTAAVLMGSTLMNTGGASTETAVPSANYFKGKYKVVTSAYLTSATAWWLLADPKLLGTVQIAFLGGKETPTIESADADFKTLGISFRGFHDFGTALTEYRASVKSDGA